MTRVAGPHPLVQGLFRETDLSSRAFFRATYGLVILWEVYRYVAHDWIEKYWIRPKYHFSYPFFEWVQPWPASGMYIHFAAMALLSIFVMLGFLYRPSALFLFLGFTYLFLLDETRYLNHFYLICVVGFVMVLVPAGGAWSLDARLFPRRRRAEAPFWSLLLLRFTVGLPYFFGGLAKLDGDWLRGQPMGMWLSEASGEFPLLGPYLELQEAAYFFSYGGLVLDLLAVPLLVWAPTRPFAMGLLLLFHFLNTRLFAIGVFPWFMILASLIFFPADWPRRLLADLWTKPSRRGGLALAAGAIAGCLALVFLGEGEDDPGVVPFLAGAMAGTLVTWTLAYRVAGRGERRWRALFVAAEQDAPAPGPARALTRRSRLTLLFLAAWVLLHALFPLRHLVIPGPVSWTEEGRRFSWHMKLRDKSARTVFWAVNPTTGAREKINARSGELESWQYTQMSTQPHLIHQYARHLREKLRAEGYTEIYVDAQVSLNGRPRQPIIDPAVDLGSTPPSFFKASWILPLTTPLPARDEAEQQE